MSKDLFLEVMDREQIRPGDLEFISEPGWEQLGKAKIGQACLDPSRSKARNSTPLVSQSGGKIGIVFAEEHLIAPFLNTYLIQ